MLGRQQEGLQKAAGRGHHLVIGTQGTGHRAWAWEQVCHLANELGQFQGQAVDQAQQC